MSGFLRGALLAAALLLLVPVAQAAGATISYTTGTAGIWTVPSSGGSPTLIANRGALAAWSPNGRQIAYVSGHTLYVAKANGKGAKRIATLPSGPPGAVATPLPSGGPPDWSPDGKQILVAAPSGDVLAVPAKGGKARTVVSLSTSAWISPMGHPVWAPDGRSIYYLVTLQALSADVAVYGVANLSLSPGAQPKQISASLPAAPTGFWTLEPYSLAISPDGGTLAVTYANRIAQGAQPLGYGIGLLASSGGGAVTMLPGYSAAAFSPDGTQLCANADAGGLAIITPTGGLASTIVPASAAPVGCAWRP